MLAEFHTLSLLGYRKVPETDYSDREECKTDH
jgi:hypothetical protein